MTKKHIQNLALPSCKGFVTLRATCASLIEVTAKQNLTTISCLNTFILNSFMIRLHDKA